VVADCVWPFSLESLSSNVPVFLLRDCYSVMLCCILDSSNNSDTQNSRLRFSGKAILHSEGVDFSTGQSFSLRLSDLLPQEELGKGNYGTVVHVIHRVTNAHMAMKQIKLELDNSKFMAIITELQVLIPPCLFVFSASILFFLWFWALFLAGLGWGGGPLD